MLESQTQTINEAIESVDDVIADLEESMADVGPDSNQYDVLSSRHNRLKYFRNGLTWQRDKAGWGGDTEITYGAMTAAENALMHRESPDNAGPQEMRLWFTAASVEAAPFVGDNLTETFRGLGQCHPGFAEWLEAQADSLSIPSDAGNGSSTSTKESEGPATSTERQDSSTTPSSDSSTA